LLDPAALRHRDARPNSTTPVSKHRYAKIQQEIEETTFQNSNERILVFMMRTDEEKYTVANFTCEISTQTEA